jgi:hypothetical protein
MRYFPLAKGLLSVAGCGGDMATKRTNADTESILQSGKPLKRPAHFDDSSIRMLVRSFYLNFEEHELEMQLANHMDSLMIPSFLTDNVKNWMRDIQLQDRADLALFWELHIHKQIVYFDQESYILLNWNQNQQT